jgi:hypothetical protein
MRVINSGIVLQQRNPGVGEMKLVWERSGELNCDFGDLFEPMAFFTPLDSHLASDYLQFYLNTEPHNFFSAVKKSAARFRLAGYKLIDDQLMPPLQYNTKFWDNITGHLAIRTYSEFYSSMENNQYQFFKPLKPLQDRINNQVNIFSAPTIGVHIRRTDNSYSTATSSNEKFARHMAEILQQDNDYNFFIATDDRSVEDYFEDRFPGHIMVQENKCFDRATKKGVQDALIDLYSLSHTERILGSFYSSFSEVASYIRGIPLQIVS